MDRAVRTIAHLPFLDASALALETEQELSAVLGALEVGRAWRAVAFGPIGLVELLPIGLAELWQFLNKFLIFVQEITVPSQFQGYE
jgi:hypothetical protein